MKLNLINYVASREVYTLVCAVNLWQSSITLRKRSFHSKFTAFTTSHYKFTIAIRFRFIQFSFHSPLFASAATCKS